MAEGVHVMQCSFQSTIMSVPLTLATWNATGIMSSPSYLGSMLGQKGINIIGLSDHWLNQFNIHFLQSIHREYVGFGVSDNSNNDVRTTR